MRIGQLGLGRMGAPIAARLASFDLVTYDPAVGGEPFAAHDLDVLITVLPGAAEVLAVEPLLATLRPEAVWLDLTSNDPRVSTAVAGRIGAIAVGAPLGGGPSAAAAGRLHLSVGGSPVGLEPILDRLGTWQVVGPAIGDAHLAKLLANLLWFGQAVAVAEALVLGRSLGLAPATLAPVLAAGAGGGRLLDDSLPELLAALGGNTPLADFGIDRCLAQLVVLEELAADAGSPFAVSSAVVTHYRATVARYGAIDGELLAARLVHDLS